MCNSTNILQYVDEVHFRNIWKYFKDNILNQQKGKIDFKIIQSSNKSKFVIYNDD